MVVNPIEAMMTAAAMTGLKDHDRWLNQRTLLARKLDGRRCRGEIKGTTTSDQMSPS